MMEKPNTRHYIGAPIKHVVPTPECFHHNDSCHHHHGGHCTCAPAGVCEVVVDDASGKIYLYGNIKHEDYHVPDQDCVAYAGVQPAGIPTVGVFSADEVFDGVQSQNTVTIEHDPVKGSMVWVFLNGVKQVAGPEADYERNGRKFKFNFHDLLPTDRVEIVYKYTNGD